jgi:hypothetical protein
MSQSRLNSLGLEGSKGHKDSKSNSVNRKDTYIKTFEIPLPVVAAATAQDTGIFAGSKVVQVISAYIDVKDAEATGTTKTVSIGIGGAGNNVLNGASVAAVGAVGTPVAAAIPTTSSNNEFTYTLGSDDFAELDAIAVVTCLCQDA